MALLTSPPAAAIGASSSPSLLVKPGPHSTSPSLPHVASDRYIADHRLFVQKLRQIHEEERALWDMERDELHHKIHELESTVKKLRQMSWSRDQSHPAVNLPSLSVTNTSRADTLSKFAYRKNVKEGEGGPGDGEKRGDEFWRGAGGMSNANPSRTFSPPPDLSEFNRVRIPSITSPSTETGNRAREAVPTTHSPASETSNSIPGERIDPSLDGIPLKPSGLPSQIVKSAMSPAASESPAPVRYLLRPSSPQRETPQKHNEEPRPRLAELPSSKLTTEDLLVKDAGHTPLARMSSVSETSSESTPGKRHPEQGRPPLNPYLDRLIAPQPFEDSSSYFPVSGEAPESETILKEPLSLRKDANKENSQFLHELDEKLLKAQRLHGSTNGTTDTGVHTQLCTGLDDRAQALPPPPGVNEGEDLDSEPKLKMKRSMNFGSVFGDNGLGKGF